MTSPFAALAAAQAERFAAARKPRPEATPEQAKPVIVESAEIAALRLALPIVERAARATPTTYSRMERQQEAAKAARAIRAILAAQAD
jgi:hypothetical protein